MADLLQRGDREPGPRGRREQPWHRHAVGGAGGTGALAAFALTLATGPAAAQASPEAPATPTAEDTALAAEARGDWVTALDAWRACAESTQGNTARRCAARVTTLEPQAGDGFVGWATLDAVRRSYVALGSDAALARIEAALAQGPDGPAAPEMRLWLAHEYTRRGDTRKAAAARAAVATEPAQPAAARAWMTSIDTREAEEARRRPYAWAGATFAAVYLGRAAWGPGPLQWRSAGVAAVLLGLAPVAFAWAYGNDDEPGFMWIGAVLTTAVLLAPRAPVWIAVPGTLGAMLATVWWNGWFPSLGW